MKTPVALLFLASALAGPTLADPTLSDASLTARVDPRSGSVRVNVRYRLVPEGASGVPFSLLQIGGQRASGFTASIGDGPALRTNLEPETQVQRNGRIELPDGPGDIIELDLRYSVEGFGAAPTDAVELQIPVAVVRWPPREGDSVFVAELLVPADLEVFDSFPPALRTAADSAEGWSRHQTTLPTVPSLLRLEMSESPPLLTVARLVDALAALVILGAGVLAYSLVRGFGS